METTRAAVVNCFEALRPEDDVRHFEVETYAWGVLPPHLQPPSLAEGIAAEMRWVVEAAGGGVSGGG